MTHGRRGQRCRSQNLRGKRDVLGIAGELTLSECLGDAFVIELIFTNEVICGGHYFVLNVIDIRHETDVSAPECLWPRLLEAQRF